MLVVEREVKKCRSEPECALKGSATSLQVASVALGQTLSVSAELREGKVWQPLVGSRL